MAVLLALRRFEAVFLSPLSLQAVLLALLSLQAVLLSPLGLEAVLLALLGFEQFLLAFPCVPFLPSLLDGCPPGKQALTRPGEDARMIVLPLLGRFLACRLGCMGIDRCGGSRASRRGCRCG